MLRASSCRPFQSFSQLNDRSPGIGNHRAVHVAQRALARQRGRQTDALRRKRAKELFQAADLEADVIDGTPGRTHERLLRLPAEEVEHVADAGEISAEE